MAQIAAGGDEAILAASRAIVAWSHRRADRIAFNSNPSFGALRAVFNEAGATIPALRIFTDGTMAVYFEYMLASRYSTPSR